MPIIPLTPAQINLGLRSGYSLAAAQFTYSLPGAGSVWEIDAFNYTTSTSNPANDYQPFDAAYSTLSTAQASNFVFALTAWDDLIQPDFVQVADNAGGHGEVRVAFTGAQMSGGIAGYAFQGSNTVPTSIVGDVWLSSATVGESFAPGTTSYSTLLHELGHVLGLKHSFEGTPIPAPYDDTRYTVLSYTTPRALVFTASSGANLPVAALTPSILDIAAAQGLYGADTGTRTGNDTYTFNQTDLVHSAIYDAGGTDTLDISTVTRNSTVDLRPGAVSSIGRWTEAEQIAYYNATFGYTVGSLSAAYAGGAFFEWTDNLGIAFGTMIENLVAGAGNDTITGNNAANQLRGNAGSDAIDGGNGFDTALFSGTSGAYSWTVTGGTTLISGPDGTDSLVNLERMQFANASYVFESLGVGAPVLALAGFGAGASAGGWSSNTVFPRRVGDVDGDSRPDLVGFGEGGVSVALATGNAQFAAPVLAFAGFGAGAAAGSWSSNATYPRLLADIDGDGRDDLVGFGDGGVIAALATGGGAFGGAFLALAGFGAGAAAGGWTSNTTFPRQFADVNGDGLADVVGFGDGGVHVAFATGAGTFGAVFLATAGFGTSAAAGSWSNDDLFPRTLADINGDSRADIVGFGDGGVHVALAQANGTFAAPFFAFAGFGASAAAGGWTSNNLYFRTVADVDGDSRADLVGFGDGGVSVAYGDGTGAFASAVLLFAGFGAGASAGSWTNATLYPRVFADLNGDNAADIVGFGEGGVIAALSSSDWILA